MFNKKNNMFERILRGAKKKGVDLTSMRYGVCGAAPY